MNLMSILGIRDLFSYPPPRFWKIFSYPPKITKIFSYPPKFWKIFWYPPKFTQKIFVPPQKSSHIPVPIKNGRPLNFMIRRTYFARISPGLWISNSSFLIPSRLHSNSGHSSKCSVVSSLLQK